MKKMTTNATVNISTEVFLKSITLMLITLAAMLCFGTSRVHAAETPTDATLPKQQATPQTPAQPKKTPVQAKKSPASTQIPVKPEKVPTYTPVPNSQPGAVQVQQEELIALPIPEDADDQNDARVVEDYLNGKSIPIVANYLGD